MPSLCAAVLGVHPQKIAAIKRFFALDVQCRVGPYTTERRGKRERERERGSGRGPSVPPEPVGQHPAPPHGDCSHGSVALAVDENSMMGEDAVTNSCPEEGTNTHVGQNTSEATQQTGGTEAVPEAEVYAEQTRKMGIRRMSAWILGEVKSSRSSTQPQLRGSFISGLI